MRGAGLTNTTDRIGADYSAPPVDAGAQVRAAAGIVARVVPAWSNRFILELIPKDNGCDVFEIALRGTNVVLRGSTGGTIGTALGWYLKHHCNCELSWCGDQLALPARMPVPAEPVRVVCPHRHRFYFNYCTLSCTAAWCNWERWQREIDFMAIQGINMPLMVTGLEGVWYNTLSEFAFSDDEARTYLVGPAYFSWQWMSNIQSHGGPLPRSWIESHVALGQDGREIQRDAHPGRTGLEHVNNDYRLTLGELALNANYSLKAAVRSDGGNDSYGAVLVKRKT